MTGTVLGGMFSSGLAGAESSSSTMMEDPVVDWIVIDDGQVVLDTEPEELGPELYEQFSHVVQSFNEAIEAGHISFTDQDSASVETHSDEQEDGFNVHSEPSEIAEAMGSLESPSDPPATPQTPDRQSDVVALGCNKDGSEVESKWWGTRRDVTLYLSDDTIDDINALGTIGSGAAATVGALLKSAGVIASMSNPATVALGGIVAIYMGTINYQNNGCGSVVKTRLTPAIIASPATATPTVHSQ